MYLVDSLRKSNLKAYCCHHEQAVTTAAEGYSRIKNIGVALVTTGPGGTNAITGAAAAWLDSIPLLVINGQVKTDNITPRKNGKPIVRAIGFQELNIIDLVRPISKYAETVEKPEDIRYHLEKAVYLARSGRPGPSWVEIPLDIQAAEINPLKLRGFTPPPPQQYKIPLKLIVEKLKKAKRPLLMVGNGIRLAGAEEVLWKLINKLKINVVTALFTADDLVTYEYPYYLGRQGMWGNETANWAVDNCDLLLIVGERMQLTQLSYDYEKFASQATKIMVDIDKNELTKKTLKIDIPVHCDAKIFLNEFYKQNINLNHWPVKLKTINIKDYQSKKNYVDVYLFLKELEKYMNKYPVVTSNALAATAAHQYLKVKKNQRFIVNAGLGQMGYGLPAAVGVCVAMRETPTICIEGDGSLMLNIHELQTVFHHNLPIKLFIYNNEGYASVRNTHLNYFGKIFAADPDSGVSIPDYQKLIPAWNLSYIRIRNNSELGQLKKVFETKGPFVCELIIDPYQKTLNKWTAGLYK